MLGIADGRVPVACATRDEAIRIISGRKADFYERRQYHDENGRA